MRPPLTLPAHDKRITSVHVLVRCLAVLITKLIIPGPGVVEPNGGEVVHVVSPPMSAPAELVQSIDHDRGPCIGPGTLAMSAIAPLEYCARRLTCFERRVLRLTGQGTGSCPLVVGW